MKRALFCLAFLVASCQNEQEVQGKITATEPEDSISVFQRMIDGKVDFFNGEYDSLLAVLRSEKGILVTDDAERQGGIVTGGATLFQDTAAHLDFIATDGEAGEMNMDEQYAARDGKLLWVRIYHETEGELTYIMEEKIVEFTAAKATQKSRHFELTELQGSSNKFQDLPFSTDEITEEEAAKIQAEFAAKKKGILAGE